MTELVTRWADLFVYWSWQALLLFSLSWLIVRWGRSRMPAVRYRIWLLGMIAVALLPLLNAFVSLLPVIPSQIEPLSYVADFPVAISVVTDPIAASWTASPTLKAASGIEIASAVRFTLFTAWLTGFAWSFAILCRSWLKMHGIRKRASEVRLSEGSSVPVGHAPEIASPVLAGIFRPMILLPSRIAEWTTVEERRAIVLHEEAHLRRRDHYLIVIQRLVDAVFFFHPMVRYASRQLSLERELACDAEVLRGGAESAAYAEAILKVAERDLQRRRALQPAFNSSKKILERRIDMIFKGHHHRFPAASGRFATAVSALILIAVVSCLLIPQRSLSESLSSAADLQMIQETLAKYVPKVVPPTAQVAQSPILPAAPAAASVVRVSVASAQGAPVVQPQMGTISGKVLDQSGALIPGVLVKAQGTQTELSTRTDDTGSFAFPQVPPGRYRLDISVPDFKTKTFTFSLGPGTTWRQDVRLSVAAVETVLEVNASRPISVPNPAPSPAAADPATPRLPQRIGGDVAQANLVSQVKPVYPPAARAAGLQGNVVIQAIVGTDGSVVNPVVANGSVDELAQAALEAVRQWRYKPALLNQQPVAVPITISVSFNLDD